MTDYLIKDVSVLGGEARDLQVATAAATVFVMRHVVGG